MALSLKNDYSDNQNQNNNNNSELIYRYKALKDAGFDDETALNFAQIYSSVNEAIDSILAKSLTSNEICDLKASSSSSTIQPRIQSKLQSTIQPTIQSTIQQTMPSSTCSSIVSENNYNLAPGASSTSHLSTSHLSTSHLSTLPNYLHLNNSNTSGDLISFNSFLFSSNDDLVNKSNDFLLFKEKSKSATNVSCDNNYLSSTTTRSLSPPQLFGIDLLEKSKVNSFSIDLNKDKLGSQIIAPSSANSNNKHPINNINNNNNNNKVDLIDFGPNASYSLPPKKTFADIASANTNNKKAVQPPKSGQINKITPNKSDIISTNSPPLSHLQDSKKISSLETFPINKNNSNNNNSNINNNGNTDNINSDISINNNNNNIIENNYYNNIGSLNDLETFNKPTNLMGYYGLWGCNISPDTSYNSLKKIFRKYGNFTALQVFERKATNGSNIIFVHYDNSESPVQAIAELFGVYRKDLCVDSHTPLKLRFTPSMEQTKGELPSMEKAKKIVEKSGECFNWRLSSGCHKGERCLFKHIPINKSIDSQPWVKALKKKTNET